MGSCGARNESRPTPAYFSPHRVADLPYSSKQPRECRRQGAEKFGWSKTQATTSLDERGAGAVRVGNGNRELGALQMKAGARAVITANGSVEIAKLV
jgi:xanthine dehydrogenase YagR molybdenum-binding subunit